MIIYEGYTVKNRGFWALKAPPKRENQMKLRRVLFIDKVKCAARSRVRSIADVAIDRIPACVRSYVVHSVAASCQLRVHSIVGVAFDHTAFDRTICDQSQITALEFPWHKS